MVYDQLDSRPKGLSIILGILGVIAFAVVLGFIFGAVVMWLWNWLMPGLFGLKLITYWQGVGLVILARLLFGAFGHGYPSHHPFNYHYQQYRRHYHGKWGDYNAWWQTEGQQAFDAYLTRKSQQTGGHETSDAE